MDERLKATFADGYLRATEMSDVEVEAHRVRFKEIEQMVEEARAALIDGAVASGLITTEQAADLNRAHDERRREVERQLEEIRAHFVRAPRRAM